MEVGAALQQLEELECMLSMFPDANELQVDVEAKSSLEEFVATDGMPRPDSRIVYTLFYKELPFDCEVPTLTLTCPPGYPESESMLFEVKCPQLSREDMENLSTELKDLAIAACETQELVGLQLYQQMSDFLSQVQSRELVEHDVPPQEFLKETPERVLGRRAIYFHHIIASNKRRVVKEWARELQLGGFSKIGWPGVVIVEGAESNVQEYVRRLQHLRWKQITVRGEQTEEVNETSTRDIDSLRRLPCTFHEFPENGMSDLAAACQVAGLEELFLTTMKIYGRSEDKEKRESRKSRTL